MVVISNDPKEKADAAIEQLKQYGEVSYCFCNITSREECEKTVQFAAEKYGKVDILANSEAIGYHVSKGGVKMLTQALARELTPQGLRVVSVAPGWVNTGLMDQKAIEYGGKLHMKGRVVEPNEIANVIYLLSLDEASVINGTTVMADDGYTVFKGLHMKPQIVDDGKQ